MLLFWGDILSTVDISLHNPFLPFPPSLPTTALYIEPRASHISHMHGSTKSGLYCENFQPGGGQARYTIQSPNDKSKFDAIRVHLGEPGRFLELFIEHG